MEIEVAFRANPVAWARYTSEPVVIDGIDDKWLLERVIRTSKDEGLIWLQWSDDSLYLLAQIYDDDVMVPNALKYYEGADALEIHINIQPAGDSKPSYLQTGQDPNRYILWICPERGGLRRGRTIHWSVAAASHLQLRGKKILKLLCGRRLTITL